MLYLSITLINPRLIETRNFSRRARPFVDPLSGRVPSACNDAGRGRYCVRPSVSGSGRGTFTGRSSKTVDWLRQRPPLRHPGFRHRDLDRGRLDRTGRAVEESHPDLQGTGRRGNSLRTRRTQRQSRGLVSGCWYRVVQILKGLEPPISERATQAAVESGGASW